MKKILLVFDSFAEMTSTEASLKKVGFDTLGISNEVSINEKILSFRPDVIVACGKSHRVSSLSVGQKLKDNRYGGKVILTFAKDSRPQPNDLIKLRLDMIVDYPFDGKTLLQAIAQLEGLKFDLLLEKLSKSSGNVGYHSDSVRVHGAVKSEESVYVHGHESTGEHASKRRDRYNKFLNEHPEPNINVHNTTLSKEATQKAQNSLKKDYDFASLESLDKLKMEFVKALFKKN